MSLTRSLTFSKSSQHQSSGLKRANSFFSAPLPEHWRSAKDVKGVVYYYHEITQATIYYAPPALVNDWKLTRDPQTGVVYFFNTMTRATMSLGSNPPGCEAAARALRSGLTPPPPGPPPAVTSAGMKKGGAVGREPRVIQESHGAVAALKLQLEPALTGVGQAAAFTIMHAEGAHEHLKKGEVILGIEGTHPADVAEATQLLQKADASPELEGVKMTITLVDARPLPPPVGGMKQLSGRISSGLTPR